MTDNSTAGMSFNSPPATERPHGYEEEKSWFNVGDFDPKSYNLKMQKEEASGQPNFQFGNENQSANTKSEQQKNLKVG